MRKTKLINVETQMTVCFPFFLVWSFTHILINTTVFGLRGKSMPLTTLVTLLEEANVVGKISLELVTRLKHQSENLRLNSDWWVSAGKRFN